MPARCFSSTSTWGRAALAGMGLLLLALPRLASAQAAAGTKPDAAAAAPAASPDAATPPSAPEPPELPVQAPPAPETLPAPGDEIKLSDWDNDEWTLVKPRLSLFDVDGYFRFRFDTLRALNFNNDSTVWVPRDGSPNPYRAADFTGANIRLRVEPTINITGNIHVIATIDILDNLVLGSTPDSQPGEPGHTPVTLRTRSQNTPASGYNAVMDSIQVKRAYARITLLNEQLEVRFGRMPNHFGLGMLTNAGDCLDCDSGDVADRVQISFKAADHVFSALYDFVYAGPLTDPFAPEVAYGRSGGQPLDAVDWDDVEQFSARITRIDHPDDIKDALANDDWVLNYGTWVLWRHQSRDLGLSYYQLADGTSIPYDPMRPIDFTKLPNGTTVHQDDNRGADYVTADAFGQFYWKTFTLSLETAFIWGRFQDREIATTAEIASGNAVDLRTTEILMWGFALESSYRLTGDYAGVKIDFRAGAASGDSAPGFGAGNDADSQRGSFRGDAQIDASLTNFQFSPNYHLDLLMFRHVIGTVTDAWYLSPGVSYDFDPAINVNGHVTYSQAMFKRSTASCADPTQARCHSTLAEERTGKREMGVEIDAEASYALLRDDGGAAFRAILQGGALIPLGAFTNYEQPAARQAPQVAWTIQARLNVTF